jgi:hypothetical protein
MKLEGNVLNALLWIRSSNGCLFWKLSCTSACIIVPSLNRIQRLAMFKLASTLSAFSRLLKLFLIIFPWICRCKDMPNVKCIFIRTDVVIQKTDETSNAVWSCILKWNISVSLNFNVQDRQHFFLPEITSSVVVRIYSTPFDSRGPWALDRII